MAKQDVTVIGAGVAGLAVALALKARGLPVRVLDAAPAPQAFGAGLQLSPNATAVLKALGVWDALSSKAVSAEALAVHATSGRLLARADLAREAAAAGAPYALLHRADLQAALAKALAGAGVQVEYGQKLVAFQRQGAFARAEFDGPGGARAERLAGLVIGADGAFSAVRQGLIGIGAGHEGAPGLAGLQALSAPSAGGQARFAGQIAWRALIPLEEGARPEVHLFLGPGLHTVSYPLPARGLRNLVLVEETPEWDGGPDNPRLPATPAALHDRFAAFGAPIADWLLAVKEVTRWGLFTLPGAGGAPGQAPWLSPFAGGKGGVALIGDAAHPGFPFLAQGAAMGLEDAFTLARSFAEAGWDGLAPWALARQARVGQVLAAGARQGRLYHLSGPAQRLAGLGLAALGRLGPDLLLRPYRWLYRHDVTA